MDRVKFAILWLAGVSLSCCACESGTAGRDFPDGAGADAAHGEEVSRPGDVALEVREVREIFWPEEAGETGAPVGDSTDAEWDLPCAEDAECRVALEPYLTPCRTAHCDQERGLCRLEVSPDGAPCDDLDPCTQTSCEAGECLVTDVIDCDDSDPCTRGVCTSVAGCVQAPIEDCCHDDSDCDDGNPCTVGVCPGAGLFCRHAWIEDCCLSDSDCDDSNPCSLGRCVSYACVFEEVLGPCPLGLPFAETFDSLGDFAEGGWRLRAATGESGNWLLAQPGGDFSTQHARFDWYPALEDYDHCLWSPEVQLAGRHSLGLLFRHRFSAFMAATADNQIEVRARYDRSPSAEVLWRRHEREGEIAMSEQDLELEAPAWAVSVAVAFCVTGRESEAIDHWAVDDIWLWGGRLPEWAALPPEVRAPAGETKRVPLAATDADDDPLNFALTAGAPEWVALEQEPPGAPQATLVLTPQGWHEGVHTLVLTVDDGGPPVATELQVEVVVEGETVWFVEDFTQGELIPPGFTTETTPEETATHWQIAKGADGARHARLESEPRRHDFDDTLVSPEVPISASFSAVRARFSQALSVAPLTPSAEEGISLRIAVDGGAWQTVWRHAAEQGGRSPEIKSVDLSPHLEGAASFRMGFTGAGGDSRRLGVWRLDEIAVLGME